MLEAPRTELLGIDRTKLDVIVEPIVRALGAELVDVEWKREQQGWVLRLLVEKAGAAAEKLTTEQAAVDLELCSNVAREVSPALDVADLIPHHYSLEVSSPGVERTLRHEADYLRFLGKKVKLKVHEAVAGQKVVLGTLDALEGGVITLLEGGAVRRIPMTNVATGRLVFEFGPQPKPGASRGQPQHATGKKSRARG